MAASLDPQEAERYSAQLEELIEKHADELRAFLQAHPEAHQAFGLSLSEDEK
jgi:hypothetical protein